MAEQFEWIPRHMAAPLGEAMLDTPVVCLLGPRQCGKTALAQHLTHQTAYYSFDDAGLLHTARTDPSGFLASIPDPVVLDEIQRAPELLPAIKMAVDRDRRPGRFLLTGSANLLLLPRVSESLAGRMEVVRLHPLTEAEKERCPGRFLEKFLADSFSQEINSDLPAPLDLVDRVLRGGYPEAVRRRQLSRVRQWHRDYLDSLIQRDIRDVANLRNLDHVTRLMSLLAHQNAQLLNISNLCKHLGIRRETLENHLAAIERLFLVRRLPAWHTNESRRLIKSPKIYLVDSGLASTLADLTEHDWLADRIRFGHTLEAFVVQQLIAQAAWTDPELRFWHYRDKDQYEVDLVLTKGKKVWGIEIKLSGDAGPDDAKGLKRLRDVCGEAFQGGAVLYTGSHTLSLHSSGLMAIPIQTLWKY